jgi:hypothetical protein
MIYYIMYLKYIFNFLYIRRLIKVVSKKSNIKYLRMKEVLHRDHPIAR